LHSRFPREILLTVGRLRVFCELRNSAIERRKEYDDSDEDVIGSIRRAAFLLDLKQIFDCLINLTVIECVTFRRIIEYY